MIEYSLQFDDFQAGFLPFKTINPRTLELLGIDRLQEFFPKYYCGRDETEWCANHLFFNDLRFPFLQ
ncbi:MAG: hypothetical protein CMH23_00930 [Methylophaga sp.]|jgi:hypothetical protein|nr:hypothetical protein [Methylophaga sp.]|tara:strand:- start:34740 stop:34940 length:201 start_codon:yes stop_codon:yes gene_type:complete